MSEDQKAQTRFYLGWSSRFHQTDSQLEMAMRAVDDDANAFTIVAGLLVSLATTDSEIVAAHKRVKARKLGSIELMEEKEIGVLRSEGRRFAGRLASFLGVKVRHDVFSGSGPSKAQSWFGQTGGGGNLPPLG